MAIEYDNSFDTMDMDCDFCSNCETLSGTFSECIEEAKSMGWKIFHDGEWMHKCYACVLGEDEFEDTMIC